MTITNENEKKSQKKSYRERRKRLKRPLSILIFSLIYFLLPFFNYISWNITLHTPPLEPDYFFRRINEIEFLFLILPFFAALALFSVTRFGWWFFLVFSLANIAYNFYVFLLQASVYNFSAVLQSFFAVAAVIFFTSKNLSAPYMKMYPRGWRMQVRRPVRIQVLIDGFKRFTKDMSEAGLFVIWKDCPLDPDKELKVEFSINRERFELKGTIVRFDERGVGIAFRYVDKNNAGKLKNLLAELERTKTEIV